MPGSSTRIGQLGWRHIEMVSAPLNRVLRAIVGMERYLPTGRLPGVSLMLRARKP